MESNPSYLRFALDGVCHAEDELREVFGRGLMNMDFHMLDERPFCHVELRALPGVTLFRGRNSAHTAETHDRSRLNDHFALTWGVSPGRATIGQRGLESSIGQVAFFDCAEPARAVAPHVVRHMNVRVERRLLRALVRDAEDRLMKPVSMAEPAARLLASYIDTIDWAAATDPALEHAIALHITDLMALVVGACGEAAEQARMGGLRAARLASIKRYVLMHLEDAGLSVHAVARAHGVSARSVQLLLEEDGQTFSAHLLAHRLKLAHRRLGDPQFGCQSISSIAFGCGFNDLSYFNRCFRSAYGETPSDLRHRAARRTRDSNSLRYGTNGIAPQSKTIPVDRC